MTDADIRATLAFLDRAEALKATLRSGLTSLGRRESTAEHSWRLCLMVLAFSDALAGLDVPRIISILIVHDLGEAVVGDVAAVDQAADDGRAERERAGLLALTSPLPAPVRDRILALHAEYEAGESAEARIAKAFDKIETLLQHAGVPQESGFDFAFNLDYGRKATDRDALSARIRAIVDEATRARVATS